MDIVLLWIVFQYFCIPEFKSHISDIQILRLVNVCQIHRCYYMALCYLLFIFANHLTKKCSEINLIPLFTRWYFFVLYLKALESQIGQNSARFYRCLHHHFFGCTWISCPTGLLSAISRKQRGLHLIFSPGSWHIFFFFKLVNSENAEIWPTFNIVSDVLAPLTINQCCKDMMAAWGSAVQINGEPWHAGSEFCASS